MGCADFRLVDTAVGEGGEGAGVGEFGVEGTVLRLWTQCGARARLTIFMFIQMQTSYGFYDAEPKEDLWWAPHVKDFAALSPLKEPVASLNRNRPQGAPEVRHATVCRAPSLNVPQYLLWLQHWAESLGVVVVKARLPTSFGLDAALREAERRATWVGRRKGDLFLNASGLGAAKLCGDKTMYPVRGQTVLVKGEAHATRTRIGDGYTAYCIPRPGSGQTILGGTKEKGVWDETPDAAVTAKILERGALLAPELLTGRAEGGGKEFEVVSVQCGLRPGREGGPRMEGEVVEGRRVVHAYGHASGGYQNSIGSARLVVKLVEESLGRAGGGVSAKL